MAEYASGSTPGQSSASMTLVGGQAGTGAVQPLKVAGDGTLLPPSSLPSDSLYGTAATNTAVTITLNAPGPGLAHCFSAVGWSYSGGTTAGSVTVKDGTTTVDSWDVAAVGHGSTAFAPSFRCSQNLAGSVVLAAGGSGVTGKVAVRGHYVVSVPSAMLDLSDAGATAFLLL